MLRPTQSSTWVNFFESEPYEVTYSYRLAINGVTYEQDQLFSINTYGGLFSGSEPQVGQVVSQEIDLQMKLPAETIPKMASIIPYVKATKGNTTVDWLRKGEFFIDTRSVDKRNNKLTIHGYDAVLKLEQTYNSTYTTATTDLNIIRDIATQSGLGYETGSLWAPAKAYSVPFYAGTYTMREMLGFIAAAHCGNFVLNDMSGKLEFVPLKGVTSYLKTWDIQNRASSFDVGETITFSAYPYVEVIVDDEQHYISEWTTTNSREFSIHCPFGTQAMANDIQAYLANWSYTAFEANTVTISPLAELGDKVTIKNNTYVICNRNSKYTARFVCDLAAPYNEEVEHEYQYVSKSEREYKRRIADTVAEFNVKTQEISARVSQNEEDIAELTVTADGIEAEVTSVKNSLVENEVPYPYSTVASVTRSGVTITLMDDGSIKLNGTCTANSSIRFDVPFTLQDGTYTLSGGVTRAGVYLFYSTNGTIWSTGATSVTAAKTFTANKSYKYELGAYIKSGETYNDFIVYPMLEKGSVAHDWISPVNSLYSKVTINAGNIESKVSTTDYNGNTIASLINQTSTTVQIQASHIDLTGYVTVSSLETAGSTVINGANISTGSLTVGGTGNTDGQILAKNASGTTLVTIDKTGIALHNSVKISANNIEGGTLKLGGQNGAYGKLEVYNGNNVKTMSIDYGSALQFYNGNTNIGTITTDTSGYKLRLATGYTYSNLARCDINYQGIILDRYFSDNVTDALIKITSGEFFIKRYNSSSSTGFKNFLVINDTDGLCLYNSSGVKRIMLNTSGLTFYNSSGSQTKTYPAT